MRDILLAFFLLTAFPVIVYRYQVGALVISFISFMYPQNNTYGFALTIPWLDAYFVCTIIGYFLKQGYKEYQHHSLMTVMFILYFWVCLTTVFSLNIDAAYDPWLKFTKIVAIAYLVYAMLNTRSRLNAFLKVMVISFGFYGIKGGLFTIITGGTSHVIGPPNSFFGDNNGMALVLVMSLPFMVYFITHAENLYQRYFSLFCAITTAIAVLGTQSRTGFGALVVTLLYFTWLQKKMLKAILVLIPIACVAYFFMPASWTDRMSSTSEYETDSSFQGRVDMWKASLRIANDYPVFGGGYNVIYLPEVIMQYIPPDIEARAIHSAYFQMIAEHGYVGFFIFCAFLYYLFITAQRMARQCKELPDIVWFSDLTIAIRSSIAAYMVIAFTTNIAFFDLIYFIVVVTAIADHILQRERAAFKEELDLRLAVAT